MVYFKLISHLSYMYDLVYHELIKLFLTQNSIFFIQNTVNVNFENFQKNLVLITLFFIIVYIFLNFQNYNIQHNLQFTQHFYTKLPVIFCVWFA